MRISAINCGAAFKGIAKPYSNARGEKVIPIAQNPDEEAINNAKKAANGTDIPMEGYNGNAFWLGQDMVVKKYKGENAFNNDPYREINMLDTLYDNGLIFNNSQKGLYAFESDNKTYLVSTKVEGVEPSAKEGTFTKENLKSLVGIIEQMDKGCIIPDSSKKGFSSRIRFMNYDFNGANVKLTENKAGLFDFEYSVLENIDDMAYKTVIKGNTGANCHQSDTSGLPSSLRSFEIWCLSPYLHQTANVKELFNDYLAVKGDYHKNMADFFLDFSSESAFPAAMKNISAHEKIHSKLLTPNKDGKIAKDIAIAEARKIQMATFMHEQSPFCDTGKVNPAQLKDYTKECIEYFKEGLKNSGKNGDIERTVYYEDCLELFSSWQRINKIADERIAQKDSDIMRKITNEKIPTLEQKV